MIGGMQLATKRLRLREFLGKDHDAVHRYASDPEVTRYMDWGPNDENATRVFLQEVRSSAASYPRSRYALAVVRRDLDQLIGSVELQLAGSKPDSAALGYVFARQSWGNGYATEAADALLRYGFDELGLHEIMATCDPNNNASAAVLEKIGMRPEGYLEHHVYAKGEWRDRLLFVAP